MKYLQKGLSVDATNPFKTHTQTHLQILHPHPIPWGKKYAYSKTWDDVSFAKP